MAFFHPPPVHFCLGLICTHFSKALGRVYDAWLMQHGDILARWGEITAWIHSTLPKQFLGNNLGTSRLVVPGSAK